MIRPVLVATVLISLASIASAFGSVDLPRLTYPDTPPATQSCADPLTAPEGCDAG